MLLEEFENVPAVIEPTDRSLISGGEICDTIILSFNGEILERVKQIDGVYEGGYLTNLNSKYPWYIYEVDGFIFDLGVSSYQLDTPERGFSYMNDGPLDMRMDKDAPLTAEEVVNEYDAEALLQIIRDYGEERWAKRIVEFIINARQEKRITTTGELVRIIKQAIPAKARQDGPHPAKRTFQAIRIEVNRELAILHDSFVDAVSMLKPKGKIGVITFHSLEDRITKQTFKELSTACICPPELPMCVCNHKAVVKAKNKAIEPSAGEIEVNPRARSAKLRVAVKL